MSTSSTNHSAAKGDALSAAKTITSLLAVAAAALFIAWFLYFLRFKGEGIGDQSTWGQFGDFLGGVLNPIFSFLALFAIVRTIQLQVVQIEEARIEQRGANIANQMAALKNASDTLTDQINQMIEVQKNKGNVSPETYKNAMDQRDKIAVRINKLSQNLLDMK